ncbi:hypothetical protein [Candidatus Poriferisodalis sp.]|uniref:hypothetical protein n=1 Tax=Candidatus Poriferisodalis sp. TaxID=3101277 RepID=UPI003D1249F0
MADTTRSTSEGVRASNSPELTAALTELANRFDQRGIRAPVCGRGGMMIAVTHRSGNTKAAINGSQGEGNENTGELAAEIASERGLPQDWLACLVNEAPTPARSRPLSVRERLLCIAVSAVDRVAERCWHRRAAPREHPHEALGTCWHQGSGTRRGAGAQDAVGCCRGQLADIPSKLLGR